MDGVDHDGHTFQTAQDPAEHPRLWIVGVKDVGSDLRNDRTKLSRGPKVSCDIYRSLKGVDRNVCNPFRNKIVGESTRRGSGHNVEASLTKGV